MKIIGIIGSKSRNSLKDYNAVASKFFEIYQKGDWICSGGCSEGGDRFAYMLHKQYSIPYLEFPADWETHPRSADFIHNTDIAKHSNILIACVTEDRTGGTEDAIRKFKGFHPTEELYLI